MHGGSTLNRKTNPFVKKNQNMGCWYIKKYHQWYTKFRQFLCLQKL